MTGYAASFARSYSIVLPSQGKDRPMPRRLANMLFTRSVRSSTRKAGMPGLLAITAFNLLLRRSPLGAAALGGPILANRAYRAGRRAQARRTAKKTLS